MKIQIMSDLHLEFGDMTVPNEGADVLVLAGDIHTGANAIAWMEQCAMNYKDVIYLLGNHEYYGQKMWKLPEKIKDSIDGKGGLFSPIHNLHFLDNDTIKIGDVNFIGSTLWSKANPMLQYMMNDFVKITSKVGSHYGKFTTDQACALHLTAKQFIKDNIVPGEKNVVVTHHAPSMKMINTERYRDNSANTGYATNILNEFNPEDINLWISGHTHGCKDIVENSIHLVSNCRGYVGHEEAEGFDPHKIIEV